MIFEKCEYFCLSNDNNLSFSVSERLLQKQNVPFLKKKCLPFAKVGKFKNIVGLPTFEGHVGRARKQC